MKKIIALLTFAACLAAQASYLTWQVSSSDASAFSGANTAALFANGNFISSTTIGGAPSTVDVSAYASGASFYVELLNYNSATHMAEVLARSGEYTYSNLGGLTDDLSDVASVEAWHATGYKAAPEPTSTLLVLVGMGLLALKRKRV